MYKNYVGDIRTRKQVESALQNSTSTLVIKFKHTCWQLEEEIDVENSIKQHRVKSILRDKYEWKEEEQRSKYDTRKYVE